LTHTERPLSSATLRRRHIDTRARQVLGVEDEVLDLAAAALLIGQRSLPAPAAAPAQSPPATPPPARPQAASGAEDREDPLALTALGEGHVEQ